jgi:hypothetical protein
MVLGILSFVFCGPLFAVPAVILGHLSLKKIRLELMRGDARSFAVAGLVLGYVNLAIFIFIAVPLVLIGVLGHGAHPVVPFIQNQ